MLRTDLEFFQQVELDSLLHRTDPILRLKTSQSCVVKLGDPYASLGDFYERVLKKAVYKTHMAKLKDILYAEGEKSNHLIQPCVLLQKQSKPKVYLSVFGPKLRENFVVLGMSSDSPTAEVQIKTEIVYTDDKISNEDIVKKDLVTQQDILDVINSGVTPFKENKCYFLRQNVSSIPNVSSSRIIIPPNS